MMAVSSVGTNDKPRRIERSVGLVGVGLSFQGLFGLDVLFFCCGKSYILF
jgi:hypothetical protein